MSRPAALSVNVALTDPRELPAVLKRLRQAGFVTRQVLEEVGVVSGSIPPDKLEALRRVEGVAEVEPDRTVQLPPPDADVQ